MVNYRKYKRILKSKNFSLKKRKKPRTTLRTRKRSYNKSLIIGFIFFALVIMLAFAIKISAPHFVYKINIKNVQSFNIPPQEIVYIYEICKELNKDVVHTFTSYSIYNRFFPEKRAAKTKEQLKSELKKTDKVRDEISEKRYQTYYNVVEAILSEPTVFPVDLNESYMFGDTWGSKTCGVKKHQGTDIFDRENLHGEIAVKAITGGVIEGVGKSGGNYYIGVRTDKGTYYMYGNLANVEGLEAGTPISSGSIIGYMSGGKSGPAKVHIGVKVETPLKKGGLWINPYAMLRYLEAFHA